MSSSANNIRFNQSYVLSSGDKRNFLRAVYKNDVTTVRNLLTKELIDTFAKTRKGENVNALSIAISK